ncbi:MAG TPA: hypothetical protein VLM11_17850 [Streptosporangiaceae bacterium]|nr:hypothetical protein [Streptosporangiaceae bacterium]
MKEEEDVVFKSAEERAAERQHREAEQAREQAARAEQAKAEEEQRKRDAFLATPVGAATAAKEAGQQFFEVQLEVGGHVGSAGFGSAEGHRTASSSAAILGEIEKVGWRMERAGYFYMVTSETSSDRIFLSGQATAVSGVTVGVYLFRTTGA